MGLGMRSALLPGEAVVVEVGDSWRHLETAAVLGVWAVAGLLLAPVVLRRMARRESGSKVAERRERALQRVA
jgi:ABC-2 type transport system permease protein